MCIEHAFYPKVECIEVIICLSTLTRQNKTSGCFLCIHCPFGFVAEKQRDMCPRNKVIFFAL